MGNGILLTHGAGSNANSPLLVALDRSFSALGFAVQRYDLSFRQKRAHGPPLAGDAARDREGLKEAVVAMRGAGSLRIFIGGHSYGGRQASMLAAEQPGLMDALLLLSYPLHPPRQLERLRTAHFPSLHTDTLFVHGSRDPFGSFEELRQALALIPARTELMPVEGVGHELKPALAGAIAEAFARFTAESKT